MILAWYNHGFYRVQEQVASLNHKEIWMLILTRRVGETLIIDDKIKVTVLGVRGHQVRLGIDAPRDVDVHREEIYQRI